MENEVNGHGYRAVISQNELGFVSTAVKFGGNGSTYIIHQKRLPWSQYLVSKPGCVGPVYGKRTSVAGDPTEESTRLPWEDVSGRRQLGKAQIHPWKDNMLNPKMEVCKMTCLFNWVTFRFDVNFPECNLFNCFFVRNVHGEKKQTKDFELQKKRNDHSISQPSPPLTGFLSNDWLKS